MGNLLNEFTRDILSDTTNQYHINRTIDQISHIVANTRVLFSNNNDYKMLTEEVIINARLIPDDMYNTDGFINDFNGKVILKPSDKKNSNDKGAFIVEYHHIPKEVCRQLATYDWVDKGFIALMATDSDDSDEFDKITLSNCRDTEKDSTAISCGNRMQRNVATKGCSGNYNTLLLKFY